MNLPMSVPTDNVYKFVAIFGLVMVIASFLASIQQGVSTNEEVFSSAPEIAKLEASKNLDPYDKAKLEILHRKLEIALSDRKFLTWGGGIFGGMGLGISVLGFVAWYKKVQRHQDRLLELQVREAEKKDSEAIVGGSG